VEGPAAPRLAAIGSARLGAPLVVLAASAVAWLAAISAQATGAASLLHHDALIDDGPFVWVALPAFMVAWQVMVAAMMLPSSLPLVRLFATVSAGQPRRGAAMVGFLGGYALVWSAFGALAFASDLAVHAAVEASAWLEEHDWLLAGAVLALAGPFSSRR
jgi:predicted metal-binding membrane protein